MKINIVVITTFIATSLGCEKEILVQKLSANPYIINDAFEQQAASKVDILWVIDNSESMAAEQQKVADGFIGFIDQLLISNVDYHIGVITTDNAILREYSGPTVTGCEKCRFISRDISCAAKNEVDSAASCDAQQVFKNLINVGIEGSSYEQGFTQVLKALGAYNLDDQGMPDGVMPPENEGFLRSDASLYTIFVSDEDEGLKQAGGPVKYFARVLKSLKNIEDSHVSVSVITGWPNGDAEPKISEIEPLINSSDDQLTETQLTSKRRIETILNKRIGCMDVNAAEQNFSEAFAKAEAGTRYIQLALMTGGVITNMCNRNYSNDLKLLGADASGYRNNFYLSRASEIEYGNDNEPFSDDDINLDCDNDGNPDAFMCVWVKQSRGSESTLVPYDQASGYVFDRELGAIRFEGDFIPTPESEITVRYRISPAH